ncbi:MAG: exodeoxyribonuclease VII small subunit [Lachnospiraceae bacterium]|nr:exodeoxyribonuclease VII small subunit [Lachnospiraceae bacterium]
MKKETEKTDNTEEKGRSLEENFEIIEDTIDRMEDEDIPLEEAFKLYQKGMKLLKECNDAIDRVEKQVLKLNAEGELEEF